MAEDQASTHGDLAELRKRIQLLEDRVVRIEHGGALPAPETPADAGRIPFSLDADLTVATVLTRVAMLSFVLLGALILRVLTQQHILGDGFGTLLGFVYAGHLILLSFLPGQPGQFARATSLFPCCGVLLGYFIALESALRAHTLSRPTAMLLIGGFTALALGVAARHRMLSLAATALVGGMLAVVGLGLEPDGVVLQLSLLIAVAMSAALLSWRDAWPFLRPAIFLLLLLLLSAGPVLAHKESMNSEALDVCATVFWLLLAVQHLLAFRRLRAAAVWLPLSTAWLATLAGLERWPALAVATAGVSVLATMGTLRTARTQPESTGGIVGLAATAVISGATGWLLLDPSGVLCALAGLALWTAARRSQPHRAWSTVSATILLTAAAIRGVFTLMQTDSSYALCAGALLAAILLLHFWRNGYSCDGTPDSLAHGSAALVLATGLLVLFAVLRGIAGRLLPDPASFQLVQTGILAVAAILLTFRGHAAQPRAVLYAGLVCMLLALVKIGLIDLRQLNGVHLLASLVLLGISSVAVSIILRQRR